MEEKIIALLNKDFLSDDGENWIPYSTRSNPLEGSETEIDMSVELCTLFDNNSFTPKTYSVDLIQVFDNPGITCFCLCICWIENGELCTFISNDVYIC